MSFIMEATPRLIASWRLVEERERTYNDIAEELGGKPDWFDLVHIKEGEVFMQVGGEVVTAAWDAVAVHAGRYTKPLWFPNTFEEGYDEFFFPLTPRP